MKNLFSAIGSSELSGRVSFVREDDGVALSVMAQTLGQEAKGVPMGWESGDGKGNFTIHLTGKADQSTIIHESGHVLRAIASKGQLASFERLYGAVGSTWMGEETENADGTWSLGGKTYAGREEAVSAARANEERFADDFVRYLKDGIAPNEEVRVLFQRLGDFLKDLVGRFRESLNPETRKAFDELFDKGNGKRQQGSVDANAQTVMQTGEDSMASLWSGASPELKERVLKEFGATEQRLAKEGKFDADGKGLHNGKVSSYYTDYGFSPKKARQVYIAVRTPAFKRWFGDWEKAVVVRELTRKVPLLLKTTQSMLSKKDVEVLFRSFNIVKNENDNRIVVFPASTAGKILSHKGFDSSRIVKYYPDLFKYSLLLDSEQEIAKEGHKAHPNIKAYHQYANKFVVDGKQYFIRFTVRESYSRKGDGDNNVHSSFISDVSLYRNEGEGSQRIRVINPGEESTTPLDEKLAQFFDSVNSSVVVTENGEPMIVYHVTDSSFDTFDLSKARSNMDVQALYFSSGKEDWQDMGKNVMPVFLNLRNPAEKPMVDKKLGNAGPVAREKLQEQGYDGTISREDGMETEYAVFDPTQVKSIDNRGTYDIEQENILFQTAYHGTPYVFTSFDMQHIGSGEGNQAFGWGMYFSESEDIAKTYARKLYNAKDGFDAVWNWLQKNTTKTTLDYVEQNKGLFGKSLDDLKKATGYTDDFMKNLMPDVASTYAIFIHDGKDYDTAAKSTASNFSLGWKSILNSEKMSRPNYDNHVIESSFENLGIFDISYEEQKAKENEVKLAVNNLFASEGMRKLSQIVANKMNDYYSSTVSRNYYTVDIPDAGFIGWYDKVPTGDADKVKSALVQYTREHLGSNRINLTEDKITENIDSKLLTDTGEHLYNSVGDILHEAGMEEDGTGMAKNTSDFLHSIGFKGMVYPANSLWAVPKRSNIIKNYVIFNADDIKMQNRTLFEMEEQEKDSFIGRAGKEHDSITDIKDLYARAERDIPYGKALLETVAGQLGVDEVKLRPQLKSVERATEKIDGDYDGNPKGLKDVYGGTFIVKDGRTEEVARQIEESHLLPLYGEMKSPKDMEGYWDYKFNFLGPNGTVMELIVVDDYIAMIKDGIGHELYEITREIEPVVNAHVVSKELENELQDLFRGFTYLSNELYSNPQFDFDKSRKALSALAELASSVGKRLAGDSTTKLREVLSKVSKEQLLVSLSEAKQNTFPSSLSQTINKSYLSKSERLNATGLPSNQSIPALGQNGKDAKTWMQVYLLQQ